MTKKLVITSSILIPIFFGMGFLISDIVHTPPRKEIIVGSQEITHRAALMEKAYYEKSFEGVPSIPCPEKVSGVIVNHHLLAQGLIADTLSCIDEQTELIVLIAPNHFSVGGSSVLTTNEGWETPYGTLLVASSAVDTLVEGETLNIDNDAYEGEHAIFNLVAFIKKVAPRASVLPIILKDATSQSEIDAVFIALQELMPVRTVIVGSFDFSHGSTEEGARHADAKSLAAVMSLDRSRIRPLDIDAVPGLDLMFSLMKSFGAEKFTLRAHTNSAELIGNEDGGVTSYITGVYSEGREEHKNEASLLFVGDVLLSREVGVKIEREGLWSVIEPVHRLFWGSDAVIGQLEGAVSGEKENPELFPPQFPIKEVIFSQVKRIGFTDFSLSTNHAHDAGEEGVLETRRVLEQNALGYFGGYDNEVRAEKILEIDGLRIGLVGYHAFGNGGSHIVVQEIEKLKEETDRVVVVAHWGSEYVSHENEMQRNLAYAFIDAGADVIMGSHPHMIQPAERYKGKMIFYSLGNFIFDQKSLSEREGLAVGVRFSEDATHFSVIPVVSNNLVTSFVGKERRDIIIEEMGLASSEITIPYTKHGK